MFACFDRFNTSTLTQALFDPVQEDRVIAAASNLDGRFRKAGSAVRIRLSHRSGFEGLPVQWIRARRRPPCAVLCSVRWRRLSVWSWRYRGCTGFGP